MKKTLLIAALSVSSFALSPAMAADEAVVVEQVETVAHVPNPDNAPKAHWGYVGQGAAHNWGGLDGAFEACAAGKAQSPINIEAYRKADLQELKGAYQKVPLEVVNNGHTVQVNVASGSTLDLGGTVFELKQFHFHTPSEHYLDGAPFPMEVHFVHMAEDGTLAVVGVLMKLGEHNPVVEGIWQNVPKAGEVKKVDTVELSASDLMPEGKGYYKYDGSLTTPPCSEGVLWHVMKDPITLSETQLTAFQSVFPVNARPVQPLGERVVIGD